MNRILLMLILLLIGNSIKAQKIYYKPVFISQCHDSIVSNIFWYVHDSEGNVYNLENFSSKGVLLPKVGKYFLNIDFDEEPQVINIKTKGETIDTLYAKRVELAIYVSNPPHSEFFDCDSLANGKLQDYYYNGKIRLSGAFKNGQPIDTLKKYYDTGEIKEIYIPHKRKRQQLNFFRNGKIRLDYNYSKKYLKDYYETGELKKTETWKRRYQHKKQEYYKSGKIKLIEDNKSQVRYFSNGTIKNQTTRKEVMVLRRIFSKNNSRWYDYKSNLFNSLGNKVAYIQYGGDNFNYQYFPDSISQIKSFQFKKIIIYKNGQETQKIDFKYVQEAGNYTRKLTLYEKKKEFWTEIKTIAADNIYKILAQSLQNKLL